MTKLDAIEQLIADVNKAIGGWADITRVLAKDNEMLLHQNAALRGEIDEPEFILEPTTPHVSHKLNDLKKAIVDGVEREQQECEVCGCMWWDDGKNKYADQELFELCHGFVGIE